jgi:hypothetical protein
LKELPPPNTQSGQRKSQVKHIKMADAVRNRFAKIKGGAKAKTKAAGWILPQEKTSFADEGTW